MRKMPDVEVRPDIVPLAGGLDISDSPLFTKPGTLRLGYNYEAAVGGGYERVGGYERFDGRPRPSDASYVLLQFTLAGTAPTPGQTINGLTSGATGKVIYISGDKLAITRVTGTFVIETLRVGVTSFGVVSNLTPAVDGFLDNVIYALAATEYRADITTIPGSGRTRGVAILNNVVYGWRNAVDGLSLAIYKQAVGGWTAVPLYYELSFTLGSVEPAEGATIAQGAVSATIKRVVLGSGSWSGTTAAGRYIITAPSGGAFTAGAFTTASQGTAPGAGAGVYHGTAITLSPNGMVRTDVYNFKASTSSVRLYGCDGVNREFEFDGAVLVPIVTGMGSVRATVVRCHKNHLMFGYKGSIQHSGVGFPYVWLPVFGAAELGIGDNIADMISVGGSEASAAMMVLGENSLFVLYGNGISDWKLAPLSRNSGCSAGSAQDVGGVVALDSNGFVKYPATQAFGNFVWDSVSVQIDAIARGQTAACSVFVAPTNKYRVFFADGTGVTGFANGKRFDWTAIALNRTIVCAVHGEIAGNARTFYGDINGYVYEADVGRSFDGDVIPCAIRLNELHQKAPGVLKQYRRLEVEAQARSAFTLSVHADFYDADEDIPPTDPIVVAQYGNGLFYDLTNFDSSYWDVAAFARKRFTIEGQGTAIGLHLAGESDNELPHTLRALTVNFTPRRAAR